MILPIRLSSGNEAPASGASELPTHNCTLRNVPKILRPVSESFRREQPIAVEFDERVLHRNKKSCIFKKIPPPPNFFVSYSPELVFFV